MSTAKPRPVIILGIESSCDDTGVAIYHEDEGFIFNEVVSQHQTHQPYGGIVPELASREHFTHLLPLVQRAIEHTQIQASEITAIAYTAGPGLLGSLLVGKHFAQGLALAWQIPLVPVHHMEGHCLIGLIDQQELPQQCLSLLLSGGHSMIVNMHPLQSYEILGSTLDDAVGEAFDKIAKLMGVGYPGGPHIEQLAKKGRSGAFCFTPPMLHSQDLSMSFSGLKTAVRQAWLKCSQEEQDKADIARAFQEAIARVLIKKMEKAIKKTRVKLCIVSGGCARNQYIRAAMNALASQLTVEIVFPPMAYCTDNGAMIAYAGYHRFLRGHYCEAAQAPESQARWSMEALS